MPDTNYSFCSLLFMIILLNDVTSFSVSAQSTTKKAENIVPPVRLQIAEGGGLPQNNDKSLFGRLNTTLPTTLNNRNESSNPNIRKQIEKPLYAEKNGETNLNHTIAVPVIQTQNTTKHEETPKHTPTKPQITEHDDNNPNKNEVKPEVYIPKQSSIDELKKKNNRANYVIPIVAVILSIPLLAIIISVVYKRGADWWQHRNYRRMDFLIEGMYNN